MSKLSYLFCDDEHLNAIAKAALKGPFAGTGTHAALLSVKASNEKHSGEYMERSRQNRYLADKRRDLMSSVTDIERSIRHYGETQELLKQHKELIAEAADYAAELAEKRNAPQSVNLPIETPINWMGEQTRKFVDAAPAKVNAPKGFRAAVDEERATQAEIRSRIAATNKRLLPQSDAEARLKDDVSRMALPLQVAPVTRLHRQLRGLAHSTMESPPTQGNIAFPTRREVFDNGRTGELDEAFRFMCALFPQQIIAAGKAEIAAIYKESGPGLSVGERERAIAGFKAEFLDSERREESLIRAAELRGEIIWRRPDASPEAVLGVMQKV